MLSLFGKDIWTADGPIVSVAGFRYPTRMAVMRIANGGLFIWSPVGISDGLRAAVDALGQVRFIVAPNSLHHLYLGEWQRAYPAAKVIAAPGLSARCPDLRLDGELLDDPDAAWAGDIDQVLMCSALTTEAVFFHRASRTVLFTDLIQHFPPGWFSGWRAIVARLDRMTGAEPCRRSFGWASSTARRRVLRFSASLLGSRTKCSWRTADQ